MTTPSLPLLTAADLKALLAIDRALARVAESIEDATGACHAHPRLAGVPEVLAILRRFADELDAAHPADRLLPRPPAAGDKSATA